MLTRSPPGGPPSANTLTREDVMDFELPEELRMLKENIRRFVDKELIPLERAVVNDIEAQKSLPKRLRG
jgi:hypothetical protein